MAEPFVQQLADLCRAHVTRAKWVFVPSHAVGHTLGERIALSGTNWLNLRFVTPLDIALRMGAPFLVERGIDPSEEGLGPALMMRLLLDLRQGGYFRPLADQPTMAQAMYATVRELRMAGLKSVDLKREAFESSSKHAELRALLASYEKYLADNNRGDMAVVYQEAMLHPDWCPILSEDCWTEMPDVIWAPLQRRLLDLIPAERIKPRALSLPGATIPRRLGDRVVRAAPSAAANPLAFMLDPASRPPASLPLQLFHAGGREAEVEEVFRRVLFSGARLDEVEIACASDEYLSLVWEKALRHDWPVTLGPGIPACRTRPGRALLGLCEWIESDFAAGHFRRLLESGDLDIEKERCFTAGQAARIVARSQAGWGRNTYELSIDALRRMYQSRAEDPDEDGDSRRDALAKVELTSRVLDWISALIGSLPQSVNDGNVALQDIVSGALNFLEHTAARKSALDHRAADALADYLGELRALGPFACGVSQALRFIRERVLGLRVATDRPRPGHLYACTLQQSGYSGRPHLYVAGLEEGRVFPGAIEDPVLLDSERRAISSALRLSTDKIDEVVYAVLARLAACGDSTSCHRAPGSEPASAASVTVSYSCRDTREFRETYASWLMLQAFRLQQGNASLSYPHMKKALGEPVSVVPADRAAAASQGRWWLRSVIGSDGEGVRQVETTFPSLKQGREADEQRKSASFTEFDGYVPEAGKALDPCSNQTILSVTELERAASCPFRFFMQRGLGVRPLDGRERDRDVWLDSLTRGSELHDLYAALLRRCREEKRRADLRKDGAWLKQEGRKRLDELHREMPAATEEIRERETNELLADLELFLQAECDDEARTPLAFEVSFGRPLGDDDDPLACEEPLEIDLGRGLTFRVAGRIDRIDKLGPTFEVIDYKTGGYWPKSYAGTFRGGRLLQHAIYGLAAVELLRKRYRDPTIDAGVYYFSSQKGRGNRVRKPSPATGAVASVLADLREVILTGTFVHPSNEEDCRFCDFESACGPCETEQAAAKASDPTLAAYRRLNEHG